MLAVRSTWNLLLEKDVEGLDCPLPKTIQTLDEIHHIFCFDFSSLLLAQFLHACFRFKFFLTCREERPEKESTLHLNLVCVGIGQMRSCLANHLFQFFSAVSLHSNWDQVCCL